MSDPLVKILIFLQVELPKNLLQLLTLTHSPSHMAKLFQVCKAPNKVWKELPNGSHNDTVAEPRYFQYIEEFLSEFVAR